MGLNGLVFLPLNCLYHAKNQCNFFSSHSRAIAFNPPVTALQLAGTPLSSHYDGRSRVTLQSALQKELEQTSNDQWTAGQGQSHSQGKENSAWLQIKESCLYWAKANKLQCQRKAAGVEFHCDATQKMICSGTVLNEVQNFIASWSTFINLIGSFPPPAPKITLEIDVPAQYLLREAGVCRFLPRFKHHSCKDIYSSTDPS